MKNTINLPSSTRPLQSPGNLTLPTPNTVHTNSDIGSTPSTMNECFLAVAEPQHVRSYKGIFLRFMAYKHGCPISFTPGGLLKVDAYPMNHVFTNEVLNDITPLDVCKWFCLIAYHLETPTADERPIFSTYNTLLYHKKSISYFTPNNLPTWDDINHTGNPTKLCAVNKVLQVIKKWEPWGEGKKSSADCPFEPEENAFWWMQFLNRAIWPLWIKLVIKPCLHTKFIWLGALMMSQSWRRHGSSITHSMISFWPQDFHGARISGRSANLHGNVLLEKITGHFVIIF